MSIAICPSCGDDIKLRGNVRVGQVVLCPYCEAELEVSDLDPVELDWAYVEQDWDDEDWDDEESDL